MSGGPPSTAPQGVPHVRLFARSGTIARSGPDADIQHRPANLDLVRTRRAVPIDVDSVARDGTDTKLRKGSYFPAFL